MSVALVLGGGALAPQIARLLLRRGFSVALHSPHGAVEMPDRCESAENGCKVFAVNAEAADACSLVACASSAGGGPVTCCVNGVDIEGITDAASSIEAPQAVALAVMEAMARQSLDPHKDATGEFTAPCVLVNLVDQRQKALAPVSRKLTEMGLMDVTQVGAELFAPGLRVNAIGIRKRRRAAGDSLQKPRDEDHGAGDLMATLTYLLDAPAVTGQLFCIAID